VCFLFFFSSRRRHTRFSRDWSSDVCSSDLAIGGETTVELVVEHRGQPAAAGLLRHGYHGQAVGGDPDVDLLLGGGAGDVVGEHRSEERRVGKERRTRRSSERKRNQRSDKHL